MSMRQSASPEAQLWAQVRARLGLRLILDAALPPVAFLVGLLADPGRPMAAVLLALAVAVVIAGLRLTRREGLRPVAASFAFVLVAALAVRMSGRAADFFLPELLLNAALALWFAASLLLRRPATATVLRMFGAGGRLPGQSAATAVWLAFWCLHLLMEVPLYLADQVFWLGATRVLFGPLVWLPVGWLSWRAGLRADRRAAPDGSLSAAAPQAPATPAASD